MSPQTNMTTAPETIGGYTVHPVASLFPLLEGDAYEDLRKSIAAYGQQEPIIIQNRTLIDGRNRLKVLLDLGRPPVWQQYDGKLPVEEYILVKNLFRRYLTDDQRMMITAQALLQQEVEAAKVRQQEGGKKHGRGRPKVGAISTQAIREPKVSEKIAAVANGTDHAARQAVAVMKEAPDLVEPVAQGKMPLPKAARVAHERKAATRAAAAPKSDYLDDKTRLLGKIHDVMRKYQQRHGDLHKAITDAVSGEITGSAFQPQQPTADEFCRHLYQELGRKRQEANLARGKRNWNPDAICKLDLQKVLDWVEAELLTYINGRSGGDHGDTAAEESNHAA